MSMCTIKIKVHIRWWVKPYLQSLSLLHRLFGYSPDPHKIGAFIADRGTRVELR
jgi:hypothetical protein